MSLSLGAKGSKPLDKARKQKPISIDEFADTFLDNFAAYSKNERAEILPWIVLEIKERLGIERVIVLGQGGYALAGLIDGTERDILKLTTDPRETEASIRLMGKKLDHVVRIISAGQSALAIRAGELEPIHPGVIVQEAVDWIGLETRAEDAKLSRIVYDVEGEYALFPERLRGRRAERMRMMIEASIEIRNRLYAEGGNLRQIAEGLTELHDSEVFVVDVHDENVGYSEKEKVFKIFDLGYSVVAGGTPIDV